MDIDVGLSPIPSKTPERTHALGKPAEQSIEIEMAEITSIQRVPQKPLIGNRTTGLVNHNYKL